MSNNALTVDRLAFNLVKWDSLNSSQETNVFLGLYLAQFILVPIVHEEGHRSVLTSNNIGSISRQFFDKNGIATVTGLTDQTLIDFRDNELPSYIRLHTAGLESEYLIKNLADDIIGFREDKMRNVIAAQTGSVFGTIGYHMTSFFPGLFTPIDEGPDQLKNDIVGHDIYGMVKNLYRPMDSFYRYTNYEHLTPDEKTHIKRGAYSSLLNLLSPSYLTFKVNDARVSLGTGFTYTPFGGSYQLSAWYLADKKISISAYLYTNRTQQLPGFSFFWKDIKLTNSFNLSLKAHLYQQPEGLDFNTRNKFNGYLGNVKLDYELRKNTKTPISIFTSISTKSNGFVVGETFLNKSTYADFGVSFSLNKVR